MYNFLVHYKLQIPGTLQKWRRGCRIKVPAITTQQFGTLEPFDGADFPDYSERLNPYFITHKIGQVAADASEAAKREADKKKGRRYNLLNW